MRWFLLCLGVVAGAFLLGRATSTDLAWAQTIRHVYTGRVGDVLRVPAAATRCIVSKEGGAPNLICAHTPRWRYQVVFYRENLFVFRNGYPDNPVFSARAKP
jgi:hypothetical protein